MVEGFTIKQPNEERIEIFLNGEYIGFANHDEDGWSGMEKVEKIVKKIANKLGIPVTSEYGEDDDE